jgi:hypothetical protein
MSATASSNSKTNEPTSSISDAEDKKMFQAVRRTGRRNALGDLSEQLAQGEFHYHTKLFLKQLFFFSF